MGPGLSIASDTLARATLFLGAGLKDAADAGLLPATIAGGYRAKVIGNGLRELDRFLNLLIDEVALLILPDGPERADFQRRRNTPNKLRAIRGAMAMASPDHERLRAIGRSRDCLFHCAGVVRRGDSRIDHRLTVGWAVAPGQTLARGERLTIGPTELEQVCRFYDRLARELLAAIRADPAAV